MLYQIETQSSEVFSHGKRFPLYYILLLEGEGNFRLDFVEYTYSGATLLFLSPYQLLHWQSAFIDIDTIAFHGDFYCIEYHKKEVACNGLLFNNIYTNPCVSCCEEVFLEIKQIIRKMQYYNQLESDFSVSVIRSYLQLILALSSFEKKRKLTDYQSETNLPQQVSDFQVLLENHFLKHTDVAYYASKYALSVSAFSKKIKQHFGKTPSELIRERTVLEAKKMLHLTYKSVKEVAQALNFEDEFYFSRYFKREVGVSPKQFREQVGISVVAK